MKTFFLILLAAAIGGGAYGYYHNPAECQKLAADLQADAPLVVADVKTICGAPADKEATAQATTSTTPGGWVAPTTIPSQANWTWTTSEGTYQNVHITKIEPDCVTILHMEGSAVVPICDLPADLQAKLNYDPAAAQAFAAQRKKAEQPAEAGVAPAVSPTATAAPAQPAMVSQGAGFPSRFSGNLVTLQGGGLQPFDASTLKHVKYWAFYYSASWCPPCRAFTPSLVQFYSQFKPQHPNFELIFVNEDHSEDDMVAYMKNDLMSWPAVSYDARGQVNVSQYAGPGIPDLVLMDSDGKVLSDSYQGQTYVGPEKVMDDIKTMVTN